MALRKAEYDRFREIPPPADRFDTRGVVHQGNAYQGSWFDAAVVSHQLGQHLAKELKAFLPKKAA